MARPPSDGSGGARLGVALAIILFVARTAAGQMSNTSADHKQATELCHQLRGVTISRDLIGLPTNGAHIWHTKLGHSGRIDFCKVLGGIKPVDPTAQDIRFEVNLPTDWNGKAVHFGGAVFDGSLAYSDGSKQPTIGLKDAPTPLQRGYLTFGSDSGHHKHHLLLPDVVNVLDSSFAANDEERRNFSQDALKKTHDVAIQLAIRRYGRAPLRTFFVGSSSGGHEALRAIQRWPQDYDGVLSGYPSWEGAELLLQFIRTSRALYAKGGFLPRSSTKLLARSVLNACDTLDGVKDGLISNVDGCRFDPSVLLCSVNSRKGCLTRQQLITVQTFATEERTVEPVWQGVQSVPGYNVLSGADLTGTLGIFHHPQRHPQILLNSSQYAIGSRIVQSFFAKDHDFKVLTLDPSTGGPYTDALLENSRAYDASDTDLSRYAAHGGKLLLVHGTADTIIPTNSSVMYYERLQRQMGVDAVDGFMRLYLVPGFGHGEGTFKAGFDSLSLLDGWVASGELPDALTVQDKSRSGRGRTRPLCAFPSWPAYNGSGNPDDSKSFRCEKSKDKQVDVAAFR